MDQTVKNNIIRTMPKFSTVEVITRYKNGWYLVSYNGQNGWVYYQQVAETIYGDSHFTQHEADVPYIGTAVYGLNTSHKAVRWVQTKLKQTGIW